MQTGLQYPIPFQVTGVGLNPSPLHGLPLYPAVTRLECDHFLTGEELSRSELLGLIELALLLKRQRATHNAQSFLKGHQLALYFEKPSLRTRVSFSVAIQELGGQAVEIQASNTKQEEPEDTARVLAGFVHAVMARVFKHSDLERMAKHSKVPIINGLSDEHHPCQILADLLTLRESFGALDRLEIAYIGDGNNILHSLLCLAPLAGVNVRYSCPAGYGPNPKILAKAKFLARKNNASIRSFKTPFEACRGAHALYTDVWTSMGFEAEKEARMKAFQNHQLSERHLEVAAPNALILHCLPMLRGVEISATLPEHPQSAIFRQSENRLHAQKALLLGLLPKFSSSDTDWTS